MSKKIAIVNICQNGDKGEPSSCLKSNWISGLTSEISFWDNYISNEGSIFQADFANRTNPEHPLQPHIVEYLQHIPDPEIKILDVGAGPLTVLGKSWPPKKIRITAVDPLADEYDLALERAGVTPLVRTTWCHGELLLERFPRASFDLVYAQNSLDHSYNPLLIIKNMLALVKVNRYMLLEHATNEAENENYFGLHQWNFNVENGDFVVWNKQLRHNITEIFGPFTEVTCRLNEEIRWLVVAIKKLAEEAPSFSREDTARTQATPEPAAIDENIGAEAPALVCPWWKKIFSRRT